MERPDLVAADTYLIVEAVLRFLGERTLTEAGAIIALGKAHKG